MRIVLMPTNVDNNNRNMVKPYTPSVQFSHIWEFRPSNVETYTRVPVINSLAEALYSTNINECKKIAEVISVDERVLNTIVKFEIGMSLHELLHEYRFRQISEYISTHKDENLENVAKQFGYSSYGSLWRFMQRIGGVTPNGEVSKARPELWLQMREERKNNRITH